METKQEVNVGKFVGRHLSQIRVVSRLLEHEVEAAKGNREVTLDRSVVESVLDMLEIFVDDCEGVSGGSRERGKVDAKPVVARLN